MDPSFGAGMTRRRLLRMVGMTAGGGAMYQAMQSLGLAADSPFDGPLQLGTAPKNASVLVLGAGLAGLVSAYELRRAGYRVEVLEFNSRAGGRNWTLKGGDRFTELGGETQDCQFDPGLYINPGPWRLPHHNHGMLHYCKALGVALEPFLQVNYNAYLHSPNAVGGRPQRFRCVESDIRGHVAELLAKAARGQQLDAELTKEDREKLLEGLQLWGALDREYKYARNADTSARRGFNRPPGGGLSGWPVPSEPLRLQDLSSPVFWFGITFGGIYEMQSPMFQPVGGMGQVGQAFARELGTLIRYQARVVEIRQNERGVDVAYEDLSAGGQRRTTHADWCVCAMPLSVLGQVPMDAGGPLKAAIGALSYAPAVKVGLQFKRRFWEQDEQIFGGTTWTELPIGNIAYPSSGLFGDGKGVLLGAYCFGLDGMQFTAMTPAERVAKALEYGAQIHPQYPREFENGIAVAWHRVPGAMGCFAIWTDELRAQHYDNLCRIDGRIVLAGEHASQLPAWQEGAVTSALDAIQRLHRKALEQGARA